MFEMPFNMEQMWQEKVKNWKYDPFQLVNPYVLVWKGNIIKITNGYQNRTKTSKNYGKYKMLIPAYWLLGSEAQLLSSQFPEPWNRWRKIPLESLLVPWQEGMVFQIKTNGERILTCTSASPLWGFCWGCRRRGRMRRCRGSNHSWLTRPPGHVTFERKEIQINFKVMRKFIF